MDIRYDIHKPLSLSHFRCQKSISILFYMTNRHLKQFKRILF